MIGNKRWIWMLCVVLAVGGLSSFAMAVVNAPAPVTAQDEASEAPKDPLKAKADAALESPVVIADTLWILIAGFLVFFMNLGFGCVETGFCRAKNAVNILSKNFIVFSAATFGFWFLGWGLMFGNGNGFMGLEGLWFLGGDDYSPLLDDDEAGALSGYEGAYSSIAWAAAPLHAKFFFQLVFCCTAATIVSGCVAERIKYGSFITFSIVLSVLIYPVVGHWIWGGGWLGGLEDSMDLPNFSDFAGSTQVHSIGGWAGLAGIIILGPRIGKYTAEGKVAPIPGHSMSLATIGCFILWLGWFGFNPGSEMGAHPQTIATVALTTNTAAVLATLSATVTCWLLMGKPDLGMTLNGALAGLVAITAPCAAVTVEWAAVIGVIAGILVVFSVLFFDKMKIDDPVGALSVHLTNGIFGTLAVGLFATEGGLITTGSGKQLISQIIGIVTAGGYVFFVSLVVWVIIKAVMGVRVSAEEEIQGLDIGEHGQEAYAGFTLQQK